MPTTARRVSAALLTAAGLAVWTWKLLVPNPVPDPLIDALSFHAWAAFLAAKGLHFTAYAVLTATAQYAAGPRFFWLVAAAMAAHGVGTEVGQCFVANRTGTARDVVIDTFGVAAGAYLLLWWGRRDAAPDAG